MGRRGAAVEVSSMEWGSQCGLARLAVGISGHKKTVPKSTDQATSLGQI